MLKALLEAISKFFASLFGGSSTTRTRNEEEVVIIESNPQDGSEIKPDTIVLEFDERDELNYDPNLPDTEFDEDIFDEDKQEEDKKIPVDPTIIKNPEVETEVAPIAPEKKGRFLWCLDNGHGKKTAGKRSPIFDDGKTQLFEYEFNRDIVKRIIEKLEEEGVAYFNVVPEVNVGNFLEERVKRANEKKSDLPKIFVSVHSNAAPTPSSSSWGASSISGIETWFYHSSRKGKKIAYIFQRHLVEETGWFNRHVKSRPKSQFFVLRKTKMPAILTENGFLNNKQQALDLMKDRIRQKIAQAHVDAILEIERKGL